MSSNNDTEQQRIDLLEGHVTDEYLESIKTSGSTDSNAETHPDDEEVDVVEALSNYDAELLDDTDEMEAEIEALQEKLDVVGPVLPKNRCAEVRGTIAALEGAVEAHSPVRTNTVEALAERIEVYQR